MRIVIDADACPKGVKKICEEKAKIYGMQLVMVIDSSHELEGDFEVLKVDKGKDSVDLKIMHITNKEDIVVTQDYGLASIVMEKVYAVLHPNGFQYTSFNIDSLMFQRYIGQKVRNAGGRTKGPKKRNEGDDEEFLLLLEKILK